MVKRLFAAAVFALLTAGAYAQVTVSAGVALSTVTDPKMTGGGSSMDLDVDTAVGFGGNIYADYLLPISIPLSLGLEFGVDNAKLEYTGGDETVTAIPLLLRAAYHFDLMSKLDLYIVGKLGYSFGVWTGDTRDSIGNLNGVSVGATGGFAFGIDLGVSYYFSQLAGLFAEAGFDDYMLETKVTGGGETITFKTPFNRFLTLGISLKF